MTVTPTEITTIQVLDVLSTIKSERGDHKQPKFRFYRENTLQAVEVLTPESDDYSNKGSCRYSDPTTGGPSCIVGWAIFAISRELFHSVAEQGGSADSLLDSLADRGITIELKARKLLTCAQDWADLGDTWRDSINSALVHTF